MHVYRMCAWNTVHMHMHSQWCHFGCHTCLSPLLTQVSGVMMSQYDQDGHKEYNQIGDGAWGAAFHHASEVDPGGEDPVAGDPDPFTVIAPSPPPELDPNDGTG
jgi:hypothetical protein